MGGAESPREQYKLHAIKTMQYKYKHLFLCSTLCSHAIALVLLTRGYDARTGRIATMNLTSGPEGPTSNRYALQAAGLFC